MVWLAVPGEFAGRLQVSRGGGGRTGWPVGTRACGWTRVTERVPEQLGWRGPRKGCDGSRDGDVPGSVFQ